MPHEFKIKNFHANLDQSKPQVTNK